MESMMTEISNQVRNISVCGFLNSLKNSPASDTIKISKQF